MHYSRIGSSFKRLEWTHIQIATCIIGKDGHSNGFYDEMDIMEYEIGLTSMCYPAMPSWKPVWQFGRGETEQITITISLEFCFLLFLSFTRLVREMPREMYYYALQLEQGDTAPPEKAAMALYR